MATVKQILDYARSQIGTHESPPFSNRVKYWDKYRQRSNKHQNFSGQPWCAAFVSDVFASCNFVKEVAAQDANAGFVYTPAGASWFQKNHRWGSTPRSGAIVFFRAPGKNRISHVGIVEALGKNGSIITIEGNTNSGGSRDGGGVYRLRRYPGARTKIVGYGYPRYSESTPTPVPQPVVEKIPTLHFKNLVLGQDNADILLLQKALAKTVGLVYSSSPGRYGPLTQQAMAMWQKKNRVRPTGKPDRYSIDLLAQKTKMFNVKYE